MSNDSIRPTTPEGVLFSLIDEDRPWTVEEMIREKGEGSRLAVVDALAELEANGLVTRINKRVVRVARSAEGRRVERLMAAGRPATRDQVGQIRPGRHLGDAGVGGKPEHLRLRWRYPPRAWNAVASDPLRGDTYTLTYDQREQ